MTIDNSSVIIPFATKRQSGSLLGNSKFGNQPQEPSSNNLNQNHNHHQLPLKQRRKSSILSSQHFHRVTNHYNKCFQNYYHSRTFVKSHPRYIPNIKTSVNHWQLRNLTKYNQLDDLLYYTRDDSIFAYDSFEETTRKLLKLNYYPRCFDNHNNMIATGGLLTSSSKLFSLHLDNLTNNMPQVGTETTTTASSTSASTATASSSRRVVAKGLFSFYNPDLSLLHTVKIGEMINNDVSLYQTSNSQLTSYLCNNDANLYCLDINNNCNFKITNKINCESNTCLNSSVKNPRSNLITAVGDSTSIFIIDLQSPDPIVKTINSGHEGGFGLSFHSQGYIFSSVFQDGTCQLYDLRHLSSPLKEFQSTRFGHQSGAFRVCKISQGGGATGDDLLMIAEHVGRVHLIDLRTFERQVIVVPAALDQFANYNQARMPIEEEEEEEKREMEQQNYHQEDAVEEKKRCINIYSDDLYSSFTSPIVYDYDYLTTVNTKLFKEFNYVPPQTPIPSTVDSQPKLNNPQWTSSSGNNSSINSTGDLTNAYDDSLSISPTSRFSTRRTSHHSPRASVSYDVDIDSQLNEIYRNYSISSASSTDPRTLPGASPQLATSTSVSSTSSVLNNTEYCNDSYQQQTNHVHGEMELSGVEFINGKNGEMKIVIGCQDAGMLIWDINTLVRRSVGGSFEFV
ncbi:hypothetical protein KGF56_002594 [Candida oxycetoniae]|uniref:DUF2415 domain-containing protein n=1 Tax=Candida oxycetoniae TaxID=497107 RepID=A0AAI9SWX0_9ASCO|nr:uncharacterized protein KGF56_002594 [Candida oxycetoniae]KAI3404599.2 hypothetical protein KGF56_002594 [Candida oxycetoniae]